ncbi:MAG: FlgD immunoglobulin-like domain containing protein [Candidatus Latescibacterota bacterium]
MSRNALSFVTAALLAFAGVASGQFLHIGNPDLQLPDLTSGGKPPVVLEIEGLADIPDYAFDGSTLRIPFTLNGSGATVWLVIYTVGQNPPLTIEGEGPAPYRDAERATPGWHVYDGVDLLVYKSAGERFEEGSNVITWNGRDMEGNLVPRGQYDLFLAAFEDEGVPHVVGRAASQLGSGQTIYFNTARGEFVNFGRGEACNMENDYVSNFDGFDVLDKTPVTDACAAREGCGGEITSATPLNAARTEWIGNQTGGTGWLKRFSYNWATRQIVMHDDWAADAGAEGGILSAGDKLPGRQYHSALSPDKKTIYCTAGVSGTVSKIVAWDVETGQLVPGKEWDLSDMFIYDNKGADRSSGPGTLARFYNGEPDPVGLTMSGHHTSLTVRMDFDGNIMYMNRNGDGYGDARSFADGQFGDYAYGHTEAPAFKYSLYSTKWGWVTNIQAGTDNSKNSFMLGEDGSGLFYFEPKHVPLTWPFYSIIIDEEGAWDGVYMTVGAFGNEAAASDFIPEGQTSLAQYPLVVLPYDQKKVTLGPATTAVTELEAARPSAFALGKAFPNPFNPETTIRFSLPWAAPITVRVYNEQGQPVRSLVDEGMEAGEYQVTWDGRDDNGALVSSGVYLYQIEAPGLRMHKKVTFLQ